MASHLTSFRIRDLLVTTIIVTCLLFCSYVVSPPGPRDRDVDFTEKIDTNTSAARRNGEENDGYGGSWWQTTDEDFREGRMENITTEGTGTSAGLELERYFVNRWERKNPQGKPSKRYYHSMAYNDVERRAIMFGGYGDEYMDDTWTYDLDTNRWQERTPLASPTARRAHSMVYDPVVDRMILFGGTSGGSETWLYDLNNDTWEEFTTDIRPPGRTVHAMVYHRLSGKSVLFGGGLGVTSYNDTWILDTTNGTWRLSNPPLSPEKRKGHSMAYEGPTGRIFLFGGKLMNGTICNDTWVYDLDTENWTEFVIGTAPPHRSDHSSFYEPCSRSVIIHGGRDGAATFNDTWSFDIGNNIWSKIDTLNGLSPRFGASMVYDERYSEAILLGGKDDDRKRDTWTFTSEDLLTDGYYQTPPVDLPSEELWDEVSVEKTEPAGTCINITITDAETNSSIPGYGNLTGNSLDISGLNDMNVTAIRMNLRFGTVSRLSPKLHSIGIDWISSNCWRDTFLGTSKIRQPLEKDEESIGYWHFDEGGGDWAEDETGLGRGHLSGPFRVGGRKGDSLAFDGVNDHVNIPDSDTLAVGNTVTISVWVKLYSNTSTGAILSKTASSGHFMDGGFGLRLISDNRVLFYKGDGVNSGNGEFGFWDGVISTTSLETYRWFHLAAVFDGRSHSNNMALYINGIQNARITGSSLPVKGNDHNLVIGAADQGTGNYFHGRIDEVHISKRVPREGEIRKSYENGISRVNGRLELANSYPPDPEQAYVTSASVRSVDISLPPNCTWNSAEISCNVSYTESLVISLVDTGSGEIIRDDYFKIHEKRFDLTDIDRLSHPSLYFKAFMESTPASTPFVLDWALNWTELSTPVLRWEIPANITVSRKMPQRNILDLREYFHDIHAGSGGTSYEVEYISDGRNVTLEMEGSLLGVLTVSNNWTGRIEVVIRYTNSFGLFTFSNVFSIIIGRIYQPPVWSTQPPDIVMDEDTRFTSDHSLVDHILDSGDGELLFLLSVPDVNVTPSLDADNRVNISAVENYSCSTNMTVTATWNETGLSSKITLNITVAPVNDPPEVELLAPGNASEVADHTVVLRWAVIDPDTAHGNITYDLFLADGPDPELYMDDIDKRNITIDGLLDKGTYYWYVIPHDGTYEGICPRGIWRFTVNLTADMHLGLTSDRSSLKAAPGKELSLNLFIKNLGPLPLEIGVYVVGDLAPYYSLNRSVTVAGGEDRVLGFTIPIPGDMAPGNYDLTIRAVFQHGSNEITLPVTISDDGGGKEEVAGSGFILIVFFAVLGVMVLSTIIMVSILVLRRRRDRKEGEDGSQDSIGEEGGGEKKGIDRDAAGKETHSEKVLEADIVHRPRPGREPASSGVHPSASRVSPHAGQVRYYTPEETNGFIDVQGVEVRETDDRSTDPIMNGDQDDLSWTDETYK